MMDPVDSTSPLSSNEPSIYSLSMSALGALGVAVQNYQAVFIFMNSLTSSTLAASQLLDLMVQATAVTTGGICSGLVNYWMNVELLGRFSKRMTSNQDYQFNQLSTLWEKIQYFLGITVFVVTGILWGLVAAVLAGAGPLAVLSTAVGFFVSGVTIVQEVETWLVKYDKYLKEKNSLTFEPRSTLTTGEKIGYIISFGNAIALSLIFTISVAQTLIVLHVAALPALLIGLTAFPLGAFTQSCFYNCFLPEFFMNFGDKWTQLRNTPQAWLGLLTVSINALVNGALAYSYFELLIALLLAAHIALPPMILMTAAMTILTTFAAIASFIVNLGFWLDQHPVKPQQSANQELEDGPVMVKDSFKTFSEKAHFWSDGQKHETSRSNIVSSQNETIAEHPNRGFDPVAKI